MFSTVGIALCSLLQHQSGLGSEERGHEHFTPAGTDRHGADAPRPSRDRLAALSC